MTLDSPIMKKIDSEKDVERTLCRYIKENGGMCIKLLCHQLIGLPDRLCLMPGGRVFFVETKTTGKKPSKIQNNVIGRIKNLGLDVYVIDSIENLKNIKI